MRTPVVQGVHSILVIYDQDWSMRPAYDEPPFVLELLKRARIQEFAAHNRASLLSHPKKLQLFGIVL
jgi:hypothetical protein